MMPIQELKAQYKKFGWQQEQDADVFVDAFMYGPYHEPESPDSIIIERLKLQDLDTFLQEAFRIFMRATFLFRSEGPELSEMMRLNELFYNWRCCALDNPKNLIDSLEAMRRIIVQEVDRNKAAPYLREGLHYFKIVHLTILDRMGVKTRTLIEDYDGVYD